MARTRYLDYRAEDATELWNEQNRAIIPAGVYSGFNISQGTAGGFSLQFTHDADPDNALAGGVIGKLVTKDGVTIEEDAHQDNVCVGSVAAGTPNIHYVVASYIYNKGLPNNDVQYLVRQGPTPGVAPTPPSLTDDEIKLGEIYVPAGAADYSTSDIRSVAKLKTTELTDQLFGDKIDGLLDPGIYEGTSISVGSLPLNITLSAGTWITQENIKITESAAQVDLLTLSGCVAGTYYLAWVVGMHKSEDTDPIPDVDYMLVEGVAQAVGTAATLPSDPDILATAVATSYKYDSATYINKIGIVRVENRAATYHIDYIKGTSVLDADTLTVYSGTEDSSYRSGHYYGYTGLQAAISDVYTLSQSLESLQRPYTIKLDGEFKGYDSVLHIPSNVKLLGAGAPASIKAENTYPVVCEGVSKSYNAVNNMFGAPVVGASVGGYTSIEFTIAVTYQTGYTLQDLLLSAGDKVVIQSAAFGLYEVGTYIATLGAWQFSAWIPDQYVVDGNPLDCDLLILKRNTSLEQLEVNSINVGTGTLSIKYVEHSTVDRVRTSYLDIAGLRYATWGEVEVVTGITGWVGTTSISDWYGRHNSYQRIRLLDEAGTAVLSLGLNELDCKLGLLEYDNLANALTLQPRWNHLYCEKLSVIGGAGSLITLHYDDQHYEHIYTNGDVQTGAGDRINVKYAEVATLELQGAGSDAIFEYVVTGTVTNTATDPSNCIRKHTVPASQNEQSSEHGNEDRNLKIVSDATFTWDLATTTLTWDATIAVDIPWNIDYCTIAAGFETLSDGDRVYVDIDREAVAPVALTKHTQTKANAANDRYYKHRIHLATRYGDVIYLWEGTRIEDSQSVTLGATPPPDGSVTYNKLGSSALAYHNEVFRNYVSPDLPTGAVIWRNTIASAITYDNATGYLTYSDVTTDLTDVETAINAGKSLSVILRNVSFALNLIYNRERIFAVDVASRRLRLSPGLDTGGVLALGVGSTWNGSVVEGNAVCTNDNLVTATYDPNGANPGRVTFGGAGLGFSATQVVPGYVYKDVAGKKYVIYNVDVAGTYVEIDAGLTNVASGNSADPAYGSIETNNNPYNMLLDDLKCVGGVEFIPIDTYGNPAKDLNTSLIPFKDSWFLSADFNAKQVYTSVPYDPRVKLWKPSQGREANQQEVNDDNDWLHYGYQNIQIVEFTGSFTDVGLVFVGGSGNITARIDGRDCGVLWSTEEAAFTYNYGVNGAITGLGFNKYTVLSPPPLTRLTPGIHHVQFFVAGGVDVDIKGIVAVNNPHIYADASSMAARNRNYVADCPGTAVINGGINTLTAFSRCLVTTSGSVWNKGGRAVSYINSLGVRQQALQFLREVETTGTTTAGSDLVSVVSTTGFRVGDIILVYDTVGGDWELRTVITILAGVLQVHTNITIAGAGTAVNVYLYGTGVDGYHERPNEEIAAYIPAMEFSVPDTLNDSKGMSHAAVGARGATTPVGVRLSDGVTLLTGSVSLANLGDSLYLTAADEAVFGFVGTGLSIQAVAVAAGADVYVDESLTGTFDNTHNAADPGGYFICGDLAYGYHTVRFVANGNFSLNSFTVWQPKKPSVAVNGLELADMNIVAETSLTLGTAGSTIPAGVFDVQPGTIQIDAGMLVNHHTAASTLSDYDHTAYGTVTCARSYLHNVMLGATAAGDYLEFTFYGNEFTLVSQNIVLGGATEIDVTVIESDSSRVAPSAVVGYTVTGLDTLPATAGHARNRWWFDRTGWYTIRFTYTSAGDYIDMDCVEIHTPFHTYRTKQPVYLDHYMPYSFSGRDIRNMSPIDANTMNNTLIHKQGAILNTTQFLSGATQIPFIFYSMGGPTELTVTFDIVNAASATLAASLEVDNLTDGVTRTAVVSAINTQTTMTLSRVLNLSAGMHFAWISTLSNVQMCHWSVESVSVSRADQALSRGFGVPMIGPANSGESSF